jgi:hypothetical protein
MSDEKRTARFQTAGGWFIELDLPLNKLMKEQYDRGELMEVDEDGNVLPEDQRTPVDVEQDPSLDERAAPRTNVTDPVTPALAAKALATKSALGSEQHPTAERPAKSGKGSSLEAWRDYAQSVDPDLTDEAAESMTRDDLIEKYGADE